MAEQKILVRLPNWLGDMVMAAGFMQALQKQFPSAAISVIVKKGLQQFGNFVHELEAGEEHERLAVGQPDEVFNPVHKRVAIAGLARVRHLPDDK